MTHIINRNFIINSLYNNKLSLLYIIITTKNILFNEKLHLLNPSHITHTSSSFNSLSSRPSRQASIIAKSKISEHSLFDISDDDYVSDDDYILQLEKFNDPDYYENASPQNLGEDVEKIICAYCMCPICGSKLYKFVSKNTPLSDLICSNVNYHISINKSFLFQIKTSTGARIQGKPYFDKSFIKLTSEFYKYLYCIDHLDKNFNLIIPNFICLNIYINPSTQQYIINPKYSFFYLPDFNNPIKPYILNNYGISLNSHFVFSIPPDFILNIKSNINKIITNNPIPNFISIDINKSIFNKNFIDKFIKKYKNISDYNTINSLINSYFSHLCPLITSNINIPIIINQLKRPHLTPKTLTPVSTTKKRSKIITPSISRYDPENIISHDSVSKQIIFNKYLKYKSKYLSLKKLLNY